MPLGKTGTLHFKNVQGYHKYLDYIHIHNKTKHHHHPVTIGGKIHAVCHNCGSIHHMTQHHRPGMTHLHNRHGVMVRSGVQRPTVKQIRPGRNSGLYIKGIPSGYGKGGPLSGNGIRIPKIRVNI